VTIAAAPLLAFPTVRPRWTVGALAALAVTWLLRWLVRGEPWPITAFNGALLLFALMIPVGIWASAFPEFTTPAAARLVLGLAAFRATVFAVEDQRTFDLALIAFCLLGLAIATVGVLAVDWPGKAGVLGAVTGRIPRLIETLPEDQGTPGVNANHLAGAIVLYLPLAVGLMSRAWLRTHRIVGRVLALVGAVVFLLVVGAVLLLAQSRSAWIGSVGGLFALVVLAGVTSRRLWARSLGAALVPGALAVLIAGVLAVGPAELAEAVYETGTQAEVEATVGSISIAGRVELWSRAIYAIQDFPYTGCGLDAFREVVHILYPLFRVSPDTDVGHAHNIFLQTAVDLGLPGLIAYVALLLVALGLCWRLARSRTARPQATRGPAGGTRPVALGLAAGLIGSHLYGLIDSVALGAKPAVVLWVALGLVAGLERVWSETVKV
jgi:putative inorganic carbon (HCO3(-)) transporter